MKDDATYRSISVLRENCTQKSCTRQMSGHSKCVEAHGAAWSQIKLNWNSSLGHIQGIGQLIAAYILHKCDDHFEAVYRYHQSKAAFLKLLLNNVQHIFLIPQVVPRGGIVFRTLGWGPCGPVYKCEGNFKGSSSCNRSSKPCYMSSSICHCRPHHKYNTTIWKCTQRYYSY